MADLDALRAEADRLRDELVAHDLKRDELAQVKRDTDAALFRAEQEAAGVTPGDVQITVDAAAIATFGGDDL